MIRRGGVSHAQGVEIPAELAPHPEHGDADLSNLLDPHRSRNRLICPPSIISKGTPSPFLFSLPSSFS